MNNYDENYKNGRTYFDDTSCEDENLSTKSEEKRKAAARRFSIDSHHKGMEKVMNSTDGQPVPFK